MVKGGQFLLIVEDFICKGGKWVAKSQVSWEILTFGCGHGPWVTKPM